MEQRGTVARGIVKSKAKHALANALSAAVNSLGPSGYPSIQMLAISISQNKKVMTSKSGVALGFGALLELAEELI